MQFSIACFDEGEKYIEMWTYTIEDTPEGEACKELSVGLYCNKDILAQAGIDVPDAAHPWTWTEFSEILEKLKPIMEEKNGYPIDMTFPVGETSIYLYAPSGSWAYAATTNTKDLEASTELIKWISGTDSSMLLFEKYKSLPSTRWSYLLEWDKAFSFQQAIWAGTSIFGECLLFSKSYGHFQ